MEHETLKLLILVAIGYYWGYSSRKDDEEPKEGFDLVVRSVLMGLGFAIAGLVIDYLFSLLG